MSNGVFVYNILLWILCGIVIKYFDLSGFLILIPALLTSLPKKKEETIE